MQGERAEMVRAGRVVMAVVVAGVMLGACSSSSKKADPSTSSSVASSSSTTSTTLPTFKVGDQVHLGRFGVEVHGVEDPYKPEGKDAPPKAGYRYVGVDTEVVDISTKPVAVFSTFQFGLVDSTGQRYQLRGMGHGASTIDGLLNPQKSRRRVVVYEIPVGAKSLSLVFAGSFGGAQVLIKLS